MPRLKSGTELETLRRQQIELARRIKEAEGKARQKQKSDHARREQLAGRAVLTHIEDHPHSQAAKAILAVLETAPFRSADRSLFAAILAEPEKPTVPADHREAAEDKAQAAE